MIMPPPKHYNAKQLYFWTSEVALILNKTDSIIVHACIHMNLKVKRSRGKYRRFTVANINQLWAWFYGGDLKVKSVERFGNKYDLRLT